MKSTAQNDNQLVRKQQEEINNLKEIIKDVAFYIRHNSSVSADALLTLLETETDIKDWD